MDLGTIITVLENKAESIANEELLGYTKEHPELNLTDDVKTTVRTRSISQLTLQLSKFKFMENEDLEEQFNNWFAANEEDDLRKACRHCLDEEAQKIREAKNGSLSSLDAYLKKHLGDVHEID